MVADIRGVAKSFVFRLIIVILMILYFPVMALADDDVSGTVKTVRVGYYSSYNFNDGAEEGSIKSGYGYDYIQAVAQYAGWKYEYFYGDWDTLYGMFINGEIDIMGGISYTPEREKQMLFPNEEMGYENYYLYKHKYDETINIDNLNSLNGKTVGGPKNNLMTQSLENWIKENNLQLEIVYYDGFDDRDADFISGAIDCITGTDNNASSDGEMEPVIKIGESSYYLAVTKSRPDILEDLNEALLTITETDPYFLQNLQYKYFSDTAVSTSLGADEKNWLDTHPVLKIGYLNNFAPYSITNEEGMVDCLVKDLFPAIFSALSISDKVELVYIGYDSYDEMTKALSDDSVDCIFPAAGSNYFAENDGLIQTSPVISSKLSLFYKGEYSDETISKIALNTNFRTQEYYVKTYLPNAEFIYCDSLEECFDCINEGKANCTLIDSLRTTLILNNYKYKDFLMTQLSKSDERCIGIKSGNIALLNIFNRALSVLGSEYGINKSYEYISNLNQFSLANFIREHMLSVIIIICIIGIIVLFVFYRAMKREERHAKEIANALDKAKVANIAKTNFLNNMSHDIRTPMNAIIGYTNIAKEQTKDENLIEYLNKISINSEHLLSLINDVLDISRIESGRISLSLKPTDMSAVSTDVIDIIKGSLNSREINFITSRPEISKYYVLADTIRVKEILLNVLSNAVKYTKDGGTISYKEQAEKSEDGKYFIIKYIVSDTGVGISEEFISHLFDEFTQENAGARTQYKGTGLGMAITKKYVEMMNGKIDVNSFFGVGTTITVEIPFEITEEPTKEKSSKADISNRLDDLKILLAEDNDFNSEIACYILNSMGATVERVVNGREAVDTISKKPIGTYDLILMDIQMPELNGYEATRLIRSMENYGVGKDIPIIAMTANAFAEDIQMAFESGMDGHIAKPINLNNMVDTITRVVRK